MNDSIKRIREGARKSAQIQKDKKKNRVVVYQRNPTRCQYCDNALIYDKRKNKYCNRSCATSMNNKGVRRHGKSPIIHPCKECKRDTTNKTFCSNDCQFSFTQKQVWASIRKGTWSNRGKCQKTLRKFLVNNRGQQCENCNRKRWNRNPIPLTVHHKNGDATNNILTNVELLCWNCHALTKNFGSKNKECTRKYRYNKL